MDIEFEVKYLHIEWLNKNRILKIEEAQQPLKIEKISDKEFLTEIQTYTRIEKYKFAQVGLCILNNEDLDIKPYFLNSSGEKIYLLKVSYNDKNWWIENGEWSSQYKILTTELWNHIGEVDLYFGDLKLQLSVSTISFTKEELNSYLEDFKNDFYYLIFRPDSLTQINIKKSNNQIKILDKESIAKFITFVNFIEKILENPKKELKEVQALKDIKNVKPVIKTFIEVATKVIRKQLTSREIIESFDVPENRFVYFITDRVYHILLSISKVSKSLNAFYEEKVEFNKKRLKQLDNTTIKISKEVFEERIKVLEEKIEYIHNQLENVEKLQNIEVKKEYQRKIREGNKLKDKIKKAINQQYCEQSYNSDPEIFYIKLEKSNGIYGNYIQFWGKVETKSDNNNLNRYSFKFDLNLFNFLKEGQEFLIKAIYIDTRRERFIDRKFLYIYELEFLNITEIYYYEGLEISLSNYPNSDNNYPNSETQLQFWGNGKKYDSLLFKFDKTIFENIFQENSIYKIDGFCERRVTYTKKKKFMEVFFFKYITKIETINFKQQKEHNILLKQKKVLERRNWNKTLLKSEIEEQKKEKESVNKQIVILTNHLKEYEVDIEDIENIITILKKSLDKFKEMNISMDSYFPNSMTFIQNPNYQGLFYSYEVIKKIRNIDENSFIAMQQIDKMGVLDVPTLYERWCLLQIIKILIDVYHFEPQSNWKEQLSSGLLDEHNKIKNKIENISIEFENKLTERKIKLWYERKLPNNKRPDFFLEIESLRTNKKVNLIMDAKFKENVNVNYLIDELYNKKNYSENHKNMVFIIHPDRNKSIRKVTDKVWGDDAYYGELELYNFIWDKDLKPYHKYGAILLSPISKKNGNYLDNLHRLIGLAMQYKLENNDENVSSSEPIEKGFCIVCGSSNVGYKKKNTKNEKGFRYECSCKECKHIFVYNYCWKCKIRLIKNGYYWTYHASNIFEPFNIECPKCGSIYDPDYDNKDEYG